jgi:hypothetical protein
MGSQGENSSPFIEGLPSVNGPYFPAKIADFGLKYGILKKDAKNSISGRKFAELQA